MHRRTLLAGLSTALSGALAGCGGGGDGGGDGGETPADTATPTATPMPADTATPTATPTPADTATPAETATATPASDGGGGSESFTHELDEEFTVGEAGNQVTYRIIEFTRADQIGSEMNNSTAEGTFLIVTLEVTNPRDGPLEFPWFEFRVRTEGDWQRFDREPSQKIGSDDRIEVEHIGDDTFEPGASKIGAVVFDVDPDRTYRLWITPTGDVETPEHFVPVPDLSEIEELGGY